MSGGILAYLQEAVQLSEELGVSFDDALAKVTSRRSEEARQQEPSNVIPFRRRSDELA